MADLTLLNPWWQGKEQLARDKHLRELAEKKYQWHPLVAEELQRELAPDNIFTIRGPRQVGKTTLLKLLVRHLLSRHAEKALFFWSCDELVDFRELSALIRAYLETAEKEGIQEKFIFLDEISRVKNWQRAIKFLVDSGELKNCCLLLTGSHALDLNIEKLPGRTGKRGKDLLLLPLSFSEFVALVRPDLAQKIKKVTAFNLQEINQKAERAALFRRELKNLFETYLITGGFPLTINEYFTAKKIPDYVYELYFKWIVGDLVKWGKEERILIQLMKSLIRTQGSAISWDALAKDAEIKSHKTIASYADILENMFATIILYFLKLDQKVPDYNKNKKIYFLDPFIFHAFNRKIYFKEEEITPALLEGVIISNLLRRGKGYYWKNKKEVDLLLQVQQQLFPCEVKYQNRISREDYKGLFYFNRGLLLTKDYLQLGEKYSAVPAPVLLSMI